MTESPEVSSAEQVHSALDQLGPEGRARVLAVTARYFSDLDLAEEVVQEAMVQALRTWVQNGVPRVPEAWLITAAKRRGIDLLRRDQARAGAIPRLGALQERAPAPEGAGDPAEAAGAAGADVGNSGVDERLGLFFACCHPVLKPEERVALTLRFLAGMSTAEVAHGLLVPVTTMQQRIVRAKRRIRSLGISFEIPARAESWQRLAAVQRVVYMLYAEGFARSAGRAHTSDDMTTEAIRLARMLRDLLPGSAEVTGMLALLLLTQGRRPARTDDAGRPVPLAEQDRRRWDRGLIEEGLDLAQRAASSAGAASYAVQAAIAAVHAEAADVESTDWPQIAVLYRMLDSYEPSPVVRLGRAVALGRAQGPRVGLEQMEGLAEEEMLQRYRPFHIARAMTLEELGEQEAAASSYRRALQLPGNTAEDAYLTELLTGLVGAQVPE